ncbi:hypothetical protein LLG46_11525 [bacterium]|nr:hypothetical protein [bacterium]
MKRVVCILAVFAAVSLAATCPVFAAEKQNGGCVPGLASCCLIGVPSGQLENSGISVPGRSWARILIIPMITDGIAAYRGETAQEYLGVESLSATQASGKGGLGAGLKSACCWTGLPAGHMMNSGYEIPVRTWLEMVPYVGSVASLYNGYQAYNGETMQEYCEIK